MYTRAVCVLRAIEILITRHTERRADFMGGFDTPMQTTATYPVVQDEKKKLDVFFFHENIWARCVLSSKIVGEIEPH
jgi:hypothetical protein